MLTIIIFLAVCYGLSIAYIFHLRGNVRYASFTEYTRKGWPVFAPFNCFLYLNTHKSAKKPFVSADQFTELKILQDNWPVIADEAKALLASGEFDKTINPNSSSYYDIGFQTFFKRGWSKFYLNWYGYTHASARRLCPKTTALLEQLKTVNGALFSVLPPGGELSRHLDPFACSLRYHLGLVTPNQDSCYINVDNQAMSWRDGQAFVFDETYVHFAKNETDQHRLILMCDVERPMNILGRAFNFFYQLLMRGMIVPNTPEDRRGFGNTVFQKISGIINQGKVLKKQNLSLYKKLKLAINVTVVLLLIGAIYLPVYLLKIALH